MIKRRPFESQRRNTSRRAAGLLDRCVTEALESRVLFQGSGLAGAEFASNLPSHKIVAAGAPLTLTWTGDVSGDWFNPANWDQDAVPTSIDNVIINNGGLNVPVGAQFASLALNGGYLTGTIDVNGSMVWGGGSLQGVDLTVESSSILTINLGAQAVGTFSGSLDNFGQVDWLTGGINGIGLTITNESSATFEAQSPSFLGGAGITNAGTFDQPSGASELADVTFDNTGALTVEAGTLTIDDGSTFTDEGTADVAGGAGLILSGNVTLNPGASFTDSGAVTLEGSVAGMLDGPNFVIPQGLNDSTFTVVGTLTWSGGDLVDVDAIVANTGTLNIDIGSMNYNNWSGALDNFGTVNWLSGGFNAASLTITNESTGVFSAQANNALNGAIIDNAGTFTQPSGSTELVDVNFTNTGSVNVQSGTLAIDTSSIFIDNATVDVASGAQLSLAGNLTFSHGEDFTGPGTVNLAGTAHGALNGLNFQGPGGFEQTVFELNGNLTWTGGNMVDVDVCVTAGSTLNIELGSGTIDSWTGQLDNYGTVNWISGGITGAGLTLYNEIGATFEMEADATLTGAVISNFGTIIQPTGSTGTELSDVTFNNTADIEIQAGMLSIDNGSNVTDSGTINIAAGQELLISGNSFFGVSEQFTGTGKAMLYGTVNGNLNGSNFQVPAGLTASTFTLDGSMAWTGGILSDVNATISSGLFIINLGTGTIGAWDGSLSNFATVDWFSGGLAAPNLTITNDDSGIFFASANSIISDATINNWGTFTQLSGSNELFDVTFDNLGSLNVQAGTLSIDNGSAFTDHGTTDVSPGAQLILSGNTVFSSDDTFTDVGAVVLEGSVSGPLNGSNFQIPQGLLDSQFTVNGGLSWTGGDLVSVQITNAAPSTFNVELGALNFDSWTGQLDNYAAANWISGGISGVGLTIWNEAAGVVSAQGGTINGAFITNAGQWIQPLGAGGSELSDVTFDSTGSVQVLAAVFAIDTGSTINFDGIGMVNAGAMLELVGNTSFGVASSFSGTGPVVLEGTVTGPLTGPNFQVPAGLTGSTFSLSGTLTWTNGDMLAVDATVDTDGVFNIDLPNLHFSNWTGLLTNNGTVNWTGGGLNAPNLILSNAGTLNANADSTFSFLTLNNSGTLTQLDGSELFDVTFTNTGLVNVQSGTLAIDQGSSITDSAPIDVSAGAELILSGVTTVGDSAPFTGPGAVILEGSVNGDLSGPNFQVPAGLNASTFTLTGNMNWTGGDMLTVDATVQSSGIFNIALPNLHFSNWTGTLDNFGTVNWLGGGLAAPGLTITNESAATFSAQSNSSISGVMFQNDGTFIQPTGSTASELADVTFVNDGNVQVQAGTLSIDQGSTITDNATIDVATGAMIILAGDSTFATGETFTGPGLVELEGQISGLLNGPNFLVPAGLSSSTFELNGQLAWTGGDLLSVDITVSTAGALNLNTGAGSDQSWSGTLDNFGAVTWLSGGLNAPSLIITNEVNATFTAEGNATLNGATINNYGTLIQPDDSELANVTLTNNGMLQVSGGTFTIDDGSTIFDNAIIDVASGAILLLSGNSTFATGSTFTGPGLVELEGSVAGTLAGPNMSAPQGLASSTFTLTGTLTWSGGDLVAVEITVAPGGVLKIDTGALTVSTWDGQLTNSGTVNWLSGGLNAFSLTIDNELNGVFNAQSTGTLSGANITNAGDFVLPAGAVVVELTAVTFYNTANVTVDSGTLFFNDGAITFADGSVISGHIQGVITLAGNVDFQTAVFDVSQILGTATMTGNLAWNGGTLAGDLTVADGATLQLNGPTTVTGALNIAPTGTVDMTNTTLIFNYGVGNPSPLAQVQAELHTGFNDGAWNGNGISSSSAANFPGYSIGLADGDTDTNGAAQPGELVLQFTLAGDANLQISVGFADLLIVAQNYGQTGKDWSQGNFTYDPNGSVGFADLLFVAQDYGVKPTAPPLPLTLNLVLLDGLSQTPTGGSSSSTSASLPSTPSGSPVSSTQYNTGGTDATNVDPSTQGDSSSLLN